MVKQYNSQMHVIFIVIILFICYFIIKNFNISTNKSIQHFSMNAPNRPLQEGVYKYDFKTASSPTYPNGKHETGVRTITNESFGQKCISKGIVSYINNNGKLVTKDDYCEHIYLKNLNGKKIMFMFGLFGNNGINNCVLEKDGNFIYKSVYRQSDLMSDNINQISKYYKIKDGYEVDATYYNKNTKKFEPYRWGVFKKINTLK